MEYHTPYGYYDIIAYHIFSVLSTLFPYPGKKTAPKTGAEGSMGVRCIKGGFVIYKGGKGRMGFFGNRGAAGGDPFGFPPLDNDPADDQKGGERNDKNGLYQGLNPVVSDLKMGLL